jgi:beta-lactamase class A
MTEAKCQPLARRGVACCTMTPALDALTPDLDSAAKLDRGTVSVWAGPVGGPPVFTRDADIQHYAASTTKVAIMAALYRAVEEGALGLDDEVLVRNEFTSVLPTGGTFSIDLDDDSDAETIARLGSRATLASLCERMIVRSSNLATNLVLQQILAAKGPGAVNAVWRSVGATNSRTDRYIEDAPARSAGITNEVTAADLAALFSAIAQGTAASAASCEAMMRTLMAQQLRDDIPAGLPAGTPVATKNGWITGVRHGVAIVMPPGEPPFVLAVCTTTGLGEAEGAALVARVAEAAWRDRNSFT